MMLWVVVVLLLVPMAVYGITEESIETKVDNLAQDVEAVRDILHRDMKEVEDVMHRLDSTLDEKSEVIKSLELEMGSLLDKITSMEEKMSSLEQQLQAERDSSEDKIAVLDLSASYPGSLLDKITSMEEKMSSLEQQLQEERDSSEDKIAVLDFNASYPGPFLEKMFLMEEKMLSLEQQLQAERNSSEDKIAVLEEQLDQLTWHQRIPKFTTEQNFTATEGQEASIQCESRFGKPAADIKWFLGEDEIPADDYTQTNRTEDVYINMWTAVSTLTHVFSKADNGRPLRCVAEHQAYQTKSQIVDVVMNVQYAPTVTLEGALLEDVLEGMDVVLKCHVDANPQVQGNVTWRVLGETGVFSEQQEIKFLPASRNHSGNYTCQARNAVGASDPISVKIDVKYPARVLEVQPAHLKVSTDGYIHLNCLGEGNPSPKYTWVQTVPDTDEVIVRGTGQSLVLERVSLEHQGQYKCLISNTIKGEEQEDASNTITVEVIECSSPYKRVGAECFWLSNPIHLTWSEAKDHCEGMGGSLATPRNVPALHNYIQSYINEHGHNSHHYWLGATDMDHEGEWQFLDGQPILQADWFPGHPKNHHNADCLILNPFGTPPFFERTPPLFDRKCSTSLYFVCQFLG